MSRILGVDPGEKRLGIAISDPSGTIANPLLILKHVSRQVDALNILKIADQNKVSLIVVGQATDIEGQPTVQGRRALRLANAIRSQTEIATVLWDETGSTQEAKAARITLGAKSKKRREHVDHIAATIILQSYLDSLFIAPYTSKN